MEGGEKKTICTTALTGKLTQSQATIENNQKQGHHATPVKVAYWLHEEVTLGLVSGLQI